jgi:hypothetical protein
LHAFKQFFGHLQVGHIGRRQPEVGDYARQVEAQVEPQPQEGLARHLIFTEGSLPGQPMPPIGPRKTADWDLQVGVNLCRHLLRQRTQRLARVGQAIEVGEQVGWEFP